MQKTVVIISFLLVFTTNIFAGAKDVEIAIEDTKIAIPQPSGFIEITEESAPFHETFLETVTPSNMRLLTAFICEEDFISILNDEVASCDQKGRRIIVTISKRRGFTKLTEAEFKQLTQVVRQEISDVLARFNDENRFSKEAQEGVKEFNALYGTAFKADMGKVIPLGIFSDKEHVLSYAVLSKMKAGIGNSTDCEFVAAITNSFLLVKNRPLIIYVYTKCSSKEDLDWIRSKTESWLDAIVDKNSN